MRMRRRYAHRLIHAQKPERHRGLPAVDDVRQCARGAAGVRPAERAMTSIEIEIRVTRAADERDVARRCRPQSGPEPRAGRISGAGEKLFDPLDDRAAARLVEIGAVTVELRGACDAKSV